MLWYCKIGSAGDAPVGEQEQGRGEGVVHRFEGVHHSGARARANLVFTLDLNLRFAAFTLISILLLSGYLGLSMLFSIAFKDQKITLLSMFLIIGLFNSYAFHSFSRFLTHNIYGREIIYMPRARVDGLGVNALGGRTSIPTPLSPTALIGAGLGIARARVFGFV